MFPRELESRFVTRANRLHSSTLTSTGSDERMDFSWRSWLDHDVHSTRLDLVGFLEGVFGASLNRSEKRSLVNECIS